MLLLLFQKKRQEQDEQWNVFFKQIYAISLIPVLLHLHDVRASRCLHSVYTLD